MFVYVCECVCLSLWVSVCLSMWVSVCVCVCVCVCLCKWVSVFVMMSHVDKVWICSAEEFLELHVKVEAVVRNCLLSWSGQLVEVPGTPLFDQCFCFKHISLFYAPIGAFFRWYIIWMILVLLSVVLFATFRTNSWINIINNIIFICLFIGSTMCSVSIILLNLMVDFVNQYLLQYYHNLRNYSILVVGPNSFPIPTLKKCWNITWDYNFKMLQSLVLCLHKIYNEMKQ